MNAAVTPRLTLEEVAEHFAQWRSHKKKGERIPKRLWSEAIGLRLRLEPANRADLLALVERFMGV